MPVQNRCAALNIANECRQLLAARPALDHFRRAVATASWVASGRLFQQMARE